VVSATPLASVYLLSGTDRGKIRRALERLRDRYSSEAIEVFDAAQHEPDAIAGACSQQGLALDPPVANSLVVGKNDPPLGAHDRQPALVGNVVREVVGVPLDEGARCGQRSHERPGIGTPVEKEDDLRPTPLGSRTESLLRWHP
jgi:hypothetical protein